MLLRGEMERYNLPEKAYEKVMELEKTYGKIYAIKSGNLYKLFTYMATTNEQGKKRIVYIGRVSQNGEYEQPRRRNKKRAQLEIEDKVNEFYRPNALDTEILNEMTVNSRNGS
ncbi:MAG: hypothetical protein QXL16_01410, partial [Candidatus Micrarchaeaceae archaeon]